MKSIELCAGIGGITLAAEWAGIETVAFCERDPFCQKVLNKHWPSIPIFDDVCTLNKQVLEERGVDVGTIELISGGYPCQPFSLAGKQLGEGDEDTYGMSFSGLPKKLGLLGWFWENVFGHVNNGLSEVIRDLKVSVTKQGQLYYRLKQLERHTKEKGSLSLLATPTASQSYKKIRPLAPSEASGKHDKVLPGSIGEHFPSYIGQYPNPEFVEWMMGFPENWTKVD